MNMYALGVTFIVQDNENQNNVSFEHLLHCALEMWLSVCEGTDVCVLSSQFILSLIFGGSKNFPPHLVNPRIFPLYPGGHSLFYFFSCKEVQW